MLHFSKAFFTVIFLIGVSVISAQSQDLSLESIFKTRSLTTKGVSGISPMSDGKRYTRLLNDTLVVFSYKTGKRNGWLATGKEMITSSGDTLSLRSYTLSPDEKKMIIPTMTESIYRHSTQSEFYIWDCTARRLTRLSENGKQRLAEFSPDGNKVAFVRNNNLFVRDLISNTESAITTDGVDNSIINGTTDWVYEEEFGFTKGFYWSPDGTKIAWLRFDETAVPEFLLTIYGDLYPSNQKYKYPKAGENNSIVSVHVYDMTSGIVTTIEVGDNPDQYIPRIQWSNQKGQLAVQRLNRLQNKLELLLADVTSGKSKVIFTDENSAYVQITNDLTFVPGTDQFLLTSERDGFNHIYLGDSKGNLHQLTKGEWDVAGIKGFDPVRRLVWFDAAIYGPVNRDICHVNLEGKIEVITDQRGWNTSDFNSDFSYFIHNWSDMNNPPVISVKDRDGKTIRILEDNADLKEKIELYKLRNREQFSMKTAEGIELNGWMIKPDGFDRSKQYPVLMYVYGGPGSQTVRNSWDRGQLWYQYLAREGILVVSVDNRGTGFRGNDFKKMTYLQLGKYETEDQIEVAKWLLKEGYAQPGKIGIFGWSYGGYMSSLCMTRGAEVFNTGIAVAPVTNWRYYDNIYTERFMRTPQENPSGYDDNSPINHVDKLRGNFLLIHGMADDNVHFQNSVDLVTALVNADKDFDSEFYPNSNHGIYTGRNTTFHLYRRMTNFLIKHLKD